MTLRRTLIGLTTLAALGGAIATAQDKGELTKPDGATTQAVDASIVSPSPDMPANWFFVNGLYVTPEQRALIGKPAPPLNVAKWYQGELKQEDLKGKVVLLDLWATWCAPCKAAMPHTDALNTKLKDQGFVAISICSDGEESEVAPFIAEKGLKLPMAWDKDAATYKSLGGQDTFPTYAVIDRKGVLRAVGLSTEGVDKAVEKLLAEK